jgi:hypothetical protein
MLRFLFRLFASRFYSEAAFFCPPTRTAVNPLKTSLIQKHNKRQNAAAGRRKLTYSKTES